MMDKQERIKKELLYTGFATLGITGLFLFLNGLDIRNWVDSNVDMGLIAASVIGIVRVVMLSKKDQSESIGQLTELLTKRVNADFCQCNKSCNHKEDYLADMLKVFGVNLYYSLK